MSITSINPCNGRTLATFETFSPGQVDRKLQIAHERYLKNRLLPVQERAQWLRSLAALLRHRETELARLITLEMGKLIAQSQAEIQMCASVYDYYADNAEAFLADQPVPVSDGEAFIKLEPIGAILGVQPWNYPFNQVARLAAPNIAAGNTVVIKHASNVPQCAQIMEQLFLEAGAPEGTYTNLFVKGDRVSALADDSRIAALSLTGSERSGSSLAEAAGRNIKRSVLELGGSDAFIVLDDADLDLSVDMAIRGRFSNMGQACTSSKRIIVLARMYDAFLDLFLTRLQNLKTGDPMDPDTEVGPLSSMSAVEKLEEQVNDTIKAGATAAMGGRRINREGAFFEFTVLTNVKPGMRAFSEELFGPVAQVYRVLDDAEAISLANATSFGLGGTVMSRNRHRALAVASQMECGMVYINKNVSSRPELPFGGTKRSGYGRELSALGIEEFVNKKLIYIPK